MIFELIFFHCQDKEAAFFEHMEAVGEDKDQVLTRLRQAKLEDTILQPLPISTHYNSLKKNGGWEKLWEADIEKYWTVTETLKFVDC